MEVAVDVTTTVGSLLSGTTASLVCTDCLLDGDIALSGDITVNGGNIEIGGSLEAFQAFINPTLNFSMVSTWHIFSGAFQVTQDSTVSIYGNMTVDTGFSVAGFAKQMNIYSHITGTNLVLEASNLYQSSTSDLEISGPVTINALEMQLHGAITSPDVLLNGQGIGSIKIFGTISAPILSITLVYVAELGGSVNVGAINIDSSMHELTVSGNFNLSNNAAVTMSYPNISITPTATITTPISLSINTSSLSVFGRLQVPTLDIKDYGDVTTMGFSTSAPSPVLFSSGSILMTNSMQLNTALLTITCLGSTTFGGNINTTNLSHTLSGDVVVDGTLQVGANVSFATSTHNFGVSSDGHLIAPNVNLTGTVANIDGTVNTTFLSINAPTITFGENAKVYSGDFVSLGDNLVLQGTLSSTNSAKTHTSSSTIVQGASVSASSLTFESTGSIIVGQASIIKATTMDFNASSFSLGASSSISADGTETENAATFFDICPGGR